jgi:hypothetical protein
VNPLVLVLFFLSGAAGLVYEVLWTRQLSQVGLAMYELPNFVLAWVLFLLRRTSSLRADAAEAR